MAVGIRNNLSGVTQEQFDSLNKHLDMASDPPPGLIFHASGPIEGGWGVIAFWESRAAFDAFIPRSSKLLKRPASSSKDHQTSRSFPSTKPFRLRSVRRIDEWFTSRRSAQIGRDSCSNRATFAPSKRVRRDPLRLEDP
jgi:hypothetical protein